MLIFFRESGERAMYWERASRALIENAGTQIEWSKEKPECFQLMGVEELFL
jgi:hypothetical protein